jgi:hypothetical protein
MGGRALRFGCGANLGAAGGKRMVHRATYRIHVAGAFDLRMVEWFEGLTTEVGPSGDTVLLTPPIDQAALRGLLSALFNLNVPVIAVMPRVWKAEETTDA